MSSGSWTSVPPYHVLLPIWHHYPEFRGGRQHDVHELLMKVMDVKPVSTIFGSNVVVKHPKCGGSVTHLSRSVPYAAGVLSLKPPRSKMSLTIPQCVTMTEFLNEFFATETVDVYTCNECSINPAKATAYKYFAFTLKVGCQSPCQALRNQCKYGCSLRSRVSFSLTSRNGWHQA